MRPLRALLFAAHRAYFALFTSIVTGGDETVPVQSGFQSLGGVTLSGGLVTVTTIWWRPDGSGWNV